MAGINFVPDDYIQQAQTQRSNIFYMVMLLIMMAGLASSFGIIKVRQRACAAQEAVVDAKAQRMRDDIKRFDQLQAKRRDMMKTALITAELIEPVPISVILASLTNELPAGTSLLEVKLSKKELQQPKKDQVKQSSSNNTKKEKEPQPTQPLKDVQTQTDIVGLAPTDLQVAAYIERLAACPLFSSVALTESREYNNKEQLKLREFRLKAIMSSDIKITEEDLMSIREKAQTSVYNF